MMGPKPLWSRMWTFLLKDFNEISFRNLMLMKNVENSKLLHIKNEKLLTIGGNHSHESHTNENTK